MNRFKHLAPSKNQGAQLSEEEEKKKNLLNVSFLVEIITKRKMQLLAVQEILWA